MQNVHPKFLAFLEATGRQYSSFKLQQACEGTLNLILSQFKQEFHLSKNWSLRQVMQPWKGLPLTFFLLNMVPKFNSPVSKLKRWNPEVHICFYFPTGGPKRCLYWGHAQCSKRIADGPITNVAPLTKRKSCECIHDLINMNHTMSPV